MTRISLKHFLAAGFALFMGTVVLVSCKRTFDDPPAPSAPGLSANISIKDLKAMDTAPYSVTHITQDLVIRGIVNMDDKSGNYYQQISIQDSTAGIILRLAGSNLNTSYPVGRELFVKVKDLYLGEYGGVIQLGGGADSISGGVTMLSPVLQDRHIFKGALNQRIEPKVVNVANLLTTERDRNTMSYASMLIRVVGYEFQSSDTSKTWADVGASGNRVAKGCSLPTAANLTVRTSNFANFATQPVPNGNGSLTGIYSFFGSTKQLTIRDTSDAQMWGPRCGGGSTPPPAGGGTSNPTMTLTGTSPLTIDFNGLGSALPNGVRLGMSQTTSATDTNDVLVTTATPWATSTANFRNIASATGASQGADDATQSGYTNRALGIRQTSSVGDPGAGVVFILANTTGKTLTQMTFQLQSLDAGSGRTTTWAVEYAVGDAVPTSYTALAPTGTLTTGGAAYSNNLVTVPLPAALSNQAQKVWIRIYAKSGTSGSGNRATSGIDDVKFFWN
ncbi:DUF5689 domain-containing protein [Flaviaesturariibacter aridisoli]|uniref:DUF5689 domain-containing protein n=1 Tax=Flaviaesturariibacter aridisoli TaxID=2545761 RepID=A0A4R4E0Q9_9BACT|nr:DUF5689 domain-containing protein [Flaviaesturariibacter aridisoli]TCZ70562.1 hypothetical protein E0486_10505 [Flaviaesturariibacter aridisoli]